MILTVSKSVISRIIQLHSTRGREKQHLSFGETHKLFKFVYETKPSIIQSVFCLESWFQKVRTDCDFSLYDVYLLENKDLKRISLLKNPHDLLFTMNIPLKKGGSADFSSPILLLDTIQDPGNLGTIIRTAAWFGIKNIICSPDSVSYTNPKVIQASMGAFTLVDLIYTPLKSFIQSNPQLEVYATDMLGNNVSEAIVSKTEIGILFGNEGKGISSDLRGLVKETLSIHPKTFPHPESLNLSISVGIILSHLLKP